MISATRYRLTAEINRQVKLGNEIARTQVEISTGKRILAPSDDPTGAALVSELARTQAEEATWLRNLGTARTLSDRADTALTSVANNLDRANELLISAASGTLSAENRATIAAELKAIAEDIASLADTRDALGGELFRTGSPLEIPVIAGGTIVPVASRAEVFGGVPASGGPTDIVTILNNAAAAIVDPDPAARKAGTDTALTDLPIAIDHITSARGELGARANRIERLTEQLETSAIELEDQRGEIEGVDLTEAIAKLQAKQVSLQAAQMVLAQTGKTSLFDLIR
ncbi:flagellin [Sphingoaurantiacus capsulatus]|uniref:Flagellin n=1 Tax=Sphingoaurantiacus capsulatus TaxID=1771310 RepID=A0ABV7XDB6_9SPHN